MSKYIGVSCGTVTAMSFGDYLIHAHRLREDEVDTDFFSVSGFLFTEATGEICWMSPGFFEENYQPHATYKARITEVMGDAIKKITDFMRLIGKGE